MAEGSAPAVQASREHDADPLDVVVRFAGDSGDGIQLLGARFSQSTALAGLDLATFPDFPAEIRAPVGTTYGVSAFQVRFGSERTSTSGDIADVLVAMNPAALKVNLHRLKDGGLIIADEGAFSERNLKLAGYSESPLGDGSLDGYRVEVIDISKQALEVGKAAGLNQKDALRCRNMWALGLISWMFRQDIEPSVQWVQKRFGTQRAELGEATANAIRAGHAYGETAELSGDIAVTAKPALEREPGLYRLVTGGEAIAWGLVAGAQLAELDLTLCSYPITPSSPVLHNLASMHHLGIKTFQAEDEIAAAGAALGASYAGDLGVTASSGPGVALKTETLGLAISTELPLVVIDTQRAGPSTGMPTKTEQSDLFIAVFGRNADAPVPVIAARSPSDCFDVAIEAVKLAVTYMTPVIVLTDGYIANSAEPWAIPDVTSLEPFPVKFHEEPEGFHPFLRNEETGARVWAVPGTPGLEHRIGGIEKDFDSGNISYDPANHQRMTDARIGKIAGIANALPEQAVEQGEATGKLAVLGWGSTFGPISEAVRHAREEEGLSVSHIHLRHIWPLPRNLKSLLGQFDQVLIPEMNAGQLEILMRAHCRDDVIGMHKVTGQPFKISEILARIREIAA